MTRVSASPPDQRAVGMGMFAALRERDFRLYWIGVIAYVLGWNTEYVSFNWLIWELTHDPLYLGYMGLAQGLPVFLFQIFGGVLADRVKRLPLLVITQLCAALVLTTACVLTVTGLIRVEHLLLLSVLTGMFRAFEQPARMALLPYVVHRENWSNALALGAIPWQGGRVVGASMGGVAIALFGAAAGFGLSAALYFLAIGLYSLIKLRGEEAVSTGRSVLHNLVQGFTFVVRDRLFGGLIALTFFNSVFGMSYVALLPVFAGQYLNAGSGGYGVMQAASGIGAVLGTFTLAALANRLKRGRELLVGAIGFGLGLMAFSQTSSMLFAIVVLGASGYGNAFYNTLVMIILQEKVPNELRGRVLGIYGLAWNLIPLGGILAGALAAAVDARFAVLFGGALVAGMAALMLAFARTLRSI